jgi:predicted carbohydrate-binding protein with CBM5 and CBM33 domain
LKLKEKMKQLHFNFVLSFLLIIIIFDNGAHSHGRMEEPAARNCAWRFGYNIKPNYNDLEQNCGGMGQVNIFINFSTVYTEIITFKI